MLSSEIKKQTEDVVNFLRVSTIISP
jgi:hypothetical protein